MTKPVLLTVAIPAEEDFHGEEVEGVPDPVNCVLEAMQTTREPLIDGAELTVILKLSVPTKK